MPGETFLSYKVEFNYCKEKMSQYRRSADRVSEPQPQLELFPDRESRKTRDGVEFVTWLLLAVWHTEEKREGRASGAIFTAALGRQTSWVSSSPSVFSEPRPRTPV